jgi:hypothetical protein
VHEYWGRKPANVVQAYVEHFTEPGDTALDPFCGSAVVPVEAARLGRQGVGVDNDPIAVEIGTALGSPVRPADFAAAAQRVIATVHARAAPWYRTRCERCERPTSLRSLAHEGPSPAEIRYRCHHCGRRAAHPACEADLRRAAHELSDTPAPSDADILFGWQMQKLRRAVIRRWSELFSPRNLATAALLRQAIEAEPDPAVRRWLRVTFSASLAQCTKMIADFRGRADGPSWKVNSYWLPKT